MGQTLTHGVYLPDEGERNCYSGLAANWQLLDGAVGTVAEHTTALAGKAPAVHSHTKADVTDLLNSNFIPGANNSYDLGSSSYQWNNLYAKNYYYNGTAWGLDKTNTWTGDQYFRKTIIVQNSVAVSAGSYDIGINFFDSVGNRYGYIQPYVTTGNQKRLMLGSDTGELGCNSDLIPANNNLNCGNSTLKWKTLNGINPGALSLPSRATENINIDNWNFSWGANTVTAPFDGYIAIARFGSALQINDETKAYAMTYTPGSDGYICGLLPVSSGDSIKVLVTRTQTSQYEGYKFIKASGNVS